MKKIILLVISMFVVAQITSADAKITFLEHFNKDAEGKTLSHLQFPKNKKGEIKGKIDFVKTRFGYGVLCPTISDKIVYSANGVVRPDKGSVELWLTVNKNLNDVKENVYLFKVIFDKNNSMGLYYNSKMKKLVFWMKDSDTPATKYRYHDTNYPLILPTRQQISWKKGENHHITLVWSKDVQYIYLDGKKDIGSYFSSITATPSKNSKLILSGDKRKYFIFDELRIWDDVIVPEKTNSKPKLTVK